MAVEVKEQADAGILEIHLTGKLTKEDYLHFVPIIERQIKQHGGLHLLVQMHEFHGWTAGALWQDVVFDFKHFKDIERLAIVGESKWEQGMATFCKPFTSASIRYFDIQDLAAAQEWLQSGAK